jgi:hypothetical protein
MFWCSAGITRLRASRARTRYAHGHGSAVASRRAFLMLANFNILLVNSIPPTPAYHTPYASLLHCSTAQTHYRLSRDLSAVSCITCIVMAPTNARKRKRSSADCSLAPWDGDTIAVAPRRAVASARSSRRAPLAETRTRDNETAVMRVLARIESRYRTNFSAVLSD